MTTPTENINTPTPEKDKKKKRTIIALLILLLAIITAIIIVFIYNNNKTDTPKTPDIVVITETPSPEPTEEEPIVADFTVFIDGEKYSTIETLQAFEDSPEWKTPQIKCMTNLFDNTNPAEYYTTFDEVTKEDIGYREGDTFITGKKACIQYFENPAEYAAYNQAIENTVLNGVPLPAEYDNIITQSIVANPYSPRTSDFNAFSFTDKIVVETEYNKAYEGVDFFAETVTLTPEQAYWYGVETYNDFVFFTYPNAPSLDDVIQMATTSQGTQNIDGVESEIPPLITDEEAKNQLIKGWEYALSISKV